MALNLTTIDATNLFENNTPKTGLTFYTSNNEIIDKDIIGLSRKEALKYATRSGALDSVRGIRQMFGNMTGNEDLIEELKKKNKKLKLLMEHPEYGDEVTAAYFGSAIALDPVGYVPFLGWAKKAKTLTDATKYGAAAGGVYSGLGYVDEDAGQDRKLNALTGVTFGGALGLGGGAIGRAISKKINNEPTFATTVKDRKEKNIKEKVEKTIKGEIETPDEVNKFYDNLVEDLLKKKPKKLSQSVLDFWEQHAGKPLWDLTVQNWGSALVGTAAGVAGVNAFTDEESTQAQKLFYGLIATVSGVAGTKALGKINIKDKSLSEIMTAGLVDNYALPKKYIDLKQAIFGEINTFRQQAIDIVQKSLQLPQKERTLLYRMIDGDIDAAPVLSGFKKETNELFDKLGQEMVDAGLLDASVFKKNKGKYIHRSYLKYLNGEINQLEYSNAKKLLGSELRPRKNLSKKERAQLGEIEDASFAIAETARLMTNDLALYKLYNNIAKDNRLSLSADEFSKKLNAQEIDEKNWRLISEGTLDKTIKVEGEKIKTFGKLAGKYVPTEVYDDLTRLNKIRLDEGSAIEKKYLAINRLWKKSKTAWNPVVHVNNTVSNVLLYDFADADYKFLAQGFRELSKGLEGTGSSRIYDLAVRNGALNSDIVSRELTAETKDVLSDTLKRLADDNNSEIVNSQNYVSDTFKGLSKKGYDMTFGKLENIYQLEDQAFRMGLFIDRLSKGFTPAEAAADAKKWFIDYDINAPLINLMRRYPTPFLSYTYRVVPLLAESAIKRPHKFAKWSVGAYLLNEAGKEYGVGDEEKERLLMRDDLNQKMFGMPFLPSTTIKTPFKSGRDGETPLYLDVKRFIPGGDVFALDNDKGIGIPIPKTDKSLKLPTPLAPSFGVLGEVFIPLFTGVDNFTFRKLEGLGLGNDDAIKFQHIMSRLTPNIPATAFTIPLFGENADKYTPFLGKSFSSKKISTAYRQATTGAESEYSTNFTPFEAIINSFGFKLQPVDVEKLLGIKSSSYKRKYAQGKAQINKIAKQYREGKISREEAEKEIQKVYKLLKDEADKFSKTLNKVREPNVRGGLVTGPKVPYTKENAADRVDPFTGAPYSDQLARLGLVKGGRPKDLNDVILEIEYARLIQDNPEYKDVSYEFFKNNAQLLMDNVKFAESKNKNLARGQNKLNSSASGYYQFLEGSVPTAYNRTTNRFFTGEESKIFQPILDNNDSSVVSESIQDALFLSNIFESEGSDKYLTPALFEGNAEASMNAYLYNHHTLSSKEKAYNDATIKQAKKIWGVN